MTNFNCACPAIQRGQGSGFLSEGSSWLTVCMSEQRRFWRDCANAQARLNLPAPIGDKYQIHLTRPKCPERLTSGHQFCQNSNFKILDYPPAFGPMQNSFQNYFWADNFYLLSGFWFCFCCSFYPSIVSFIWKIQGLKLARKSFGLSFIKIVPRNEPQHDKINKMTCVPSKDSGQPGAQSDRSSVCAQWVGKDLSFLHANSEVSNQTGRMPRPIWVFAGCRGHFVGFVMRQLRSPMRVSAL